MAYPTFNSGDVLNATDMNAIGLWLVKTQAVGSGVSSVTVTGAFSSTYDNYKIIYSGGVGSTAQALKMTLGSTATGYYGALNYGVSTANTPLSIGSNNVASFVYAASADTTYTQANIDVFGPNLARTTTINGIYSTATVFGTFIGRELSNTQHTAFTFTPDTGTFTGGTIRVYGYRN